jgi:muramidase (phage lysozyme)
MLIDLKLKAFLDLIAFSEGTSTSPITKNDGYDVIVSGPNGPEILSAPQDGPSPPAYADHPFAIGRQPKLVRIGLTSTASGRYQVLFRWWQPYKAMLNLSDFTSASQDAVAIRQIKEKGGIALIENSEIGAAITACSNIWASLPGNDYGQGGKSMDELLAKYQELTSTSTATTEA